MKQSNLKLSNTKLLQFMIIHKMTCWFHPRKCSACFQFPSFLLCIISRAFSRQILSRIHFAFCWHLPAQGNNSAPKLTLEKVFLILTFHENIFILSLFFIRFYLPSFSYPGNFKYITTFAGINTHSAAFIFQLSDQIVRRKKDNQLFKRRHNRIVTTASSTPIFEL